MFKTVPSFDPVILFLEIHPKEVISKADSKGGQAGVGGPSYALFTTTRK